MEPSRDRVCTPKNVSTHDESQRDIDEITKEIDFLRKENNILKGRIRGSDTLGSLLQEAREANKRLNDQINQLQQRLNDSIAEKEKKELMTSSDIITSLSDITRVYQQGQITSVEVLNTRDQTAVVPPPNFPTQESIEIPETPNMNESGIESSPLSDKFAAGMKSPREAMEHNIEYDSEKYDDPSYAKQISSLNISSFNTNLSDSTRSEISTDQDVLQTNPILLPTGDNIVASMPSIQVSGIESEVHGNLLEEMGVMMKNISQMQTENEKYKKLMKIITNENHNLKVQVQTLRDGHSILIQRIKQLEQTRDDICPESLIGDNNDWVHVTAKHDKVNKEEELKQGAAFCDAKKEIQELKKANNAWKTKWNSLEKEYSTKNQDLEQRVKSMTTQLKQLKSNEEEKQMEMDKMLLNAKKRAEEEEDAKIDVEQNLHMAKHEITQLKKKIEKQETELSRVTRTKAIIETELSVLKNIGRNPIRSDDRTLKEKDTEIAVLRQQVILCTEDFERERQDRAAAQAEKTGQEEANRKLKTEKQNLTSQLNRSQQQLQEIGLNQRRIETDNENHRTHIETLKAELYRVRAQRRTAPPPPPVAESLQLLNPVSQNVFRGYVGGVSSLAAVHHPQQSLEHLPGAWTCKQCTFINYPGRTVCEICGYITEDQTPGHYSNPNLQDLQPRGPHDRDIEVDTCY